MSSANSNRTQETIETPHGKQQEHRHAERQTTEAEQGDGDLILEESSPNEDIHTLRIKLHSVPVMHILMITFTADKN